MRWVGKAFGVHGALIRQSRLVKCLLLLFTELVQRPIAPMTPAANDDDELRKRREAAEPLPLRGVVWGVCCMVLYSCMLIQRCMALYGAVWLYGAGGKA